ncbi:MAG: helix-turn-helix domain-containing protein, partial [Paracoccaceae bacterium]|nr:helix-turn-helix domain-containing protein [Paracoccaceae bacterium]
MSERELNRIEVLSSVDDGTMTATRAGDLLNLSRRHIQRLVRRLRNEGVAPENAHGQQSPHPSRSASLRCPPGLPGLRYLR